MRYSFDFRILTNRFPMKWAGVKLGYLMRAIRETLQDSVGALNDVYDSRFISYATGTQLDRWGEVLDCARILEEGETDDTYRARLLVAFRDLQRTLTVESIKDAIEATQIARPSLRAEHYAEIPTWPLTWGTPRYDYRHTMIASFVIEPGLSPTQLATIASDLQNVKLATLILWLVEDPGTGYYNLKKEVL